MRSGTGAHLRDADVQRVPSLTFDPRKKHTALSRFEYVIPIILISTVTAFVEVQLIHCHVTKFIPPQLMET